MTKFHFIIMILGCSLFYWDFSYGIGWLFGWLFVGLLRGYRDKILERVIDFENFSTRRYIGYLLLVMVWTAIPLLISFFVPKTINPLAVFGAFFAERFLMFVMGSFQGKEAR